MSINANIANSNTQTTLNAIQTAADTNFIANVDSQIQTAINLGQFQITAITSNEVNISVVFNYYTNLGYNCTFPDYLQQNGQSIPSLVQQPVNFFGFNWTQFWLNAIGAFNITNPARMTISWNLNPITPVIDSEGEV